MSDDEFDEKDLEFFTIPETPADRTPIAPAGMLDVMLSFINKLKVLWQTITLQSKQL